MTGRVLRAAGRCTCLFFGMSSVRGRKPEESRGSGRRIAVFAARLLVTVLLSVLFVFLVEAVSRGSAGGRLRLPHFHEFGRLGDRRAGRRHPAGSRCRHRPAVSCILRARAPVPDPAFHQPRKAALPQRSAVSDRLPFRPSGRRHRAAHRRPETADGDRRRHRRDRRRRARDRRDRLRVPAFPARRLACARCAAGHRGAGARCSSTRSRTIRPSRGRATASTSSR